MNEILLASHNQHKISEVKTLISPFKLVEEGGFNDPGDVEEPGCTFEQNALIKAQAFAKVNPDKIIIADDSGICLHALENRPGVFSARYAGKNASDEDNNIKMINDLKKFQDHKRTAHYECVFCLIIPKEVPFFFNGRVYGSITKKASGSNGFGYDPYFIPKDYQDTFGDLDPKIKSRISHRASAVKKLRDFLLKRTH